MLYISRLATLVSAALLCIHVQAQTKAEAPAAGGDTVAVKDGSTAIKIEDAKPAEVKNKVKGDLDTEISNPKIRADSGSKSKWSMSTGMNYRGGSVSRPFGYERPNLLGTPEQQVDTSLSADLRVRYRTTKNESFTLGTSFGMKTPFHGDINANENQVNVGDPVIGYNRTWAGLGLQNTWNLAASFAATDESRNVDQVMGVSTDYTFMKSFANGVNVGMQTVWFYNFYDSEPGSVKALRRKEAEKHDRRTEWQLAFNPTVEWYFSKRVSFRTLFSYFRWTNLYGDDQNWRMLKNVQYQSVGFGIVAARNVYLYPNVQFLPRDMKSDFTNFAMSASMNLF